MLNEKLQEPTNTNVLLPYLTHLPNSAVQDFVFSFQSVELARIGYIQKGQMW